MAKNNVTTDETSEASVMLQAHKDLTSAEARRKSLINTYKNEPKVSVYLSPMYRPYFGNIMTVTVCGISIRFKVDGSKQDVPATFADEIERRRLAIDQIIKKQKRMADITQNIESNPGDITLF